MADRIRVLIADDHPLFREGMRGRLDRAADIEVVGEAASGDEAAQLAKTLNPDVILMDIKMPGMNGIEATRDIVQTSPEIGVLVITMFEDNDSVFAAMRAGARGYLLKGADQEEVLRAVTTVANGGAVFGAALARRIAEFFAAVPSGPAAAFPQLTAREREVLDLVAAGRSNAQIAATLFLSPKTVRNNVSNIFAKLHVADRAEAIIRARDAGLGR